MSEENKNIKTKKIDPASPPAGSRIKHILSLLSGKSLALTLSLSANVILAGYHGFYAHRTNENAILLDQYASVQEAQSNVFNSLINTIPSKRTKDQEPEAEKLRKALEEIDALQLALSRLNRGSSFVTTEAYDYQEAVGKLAAAVIDMDYGAPSSLSELQAAFHHWDVAANELKKAIDGRTASFWKTVVSVI